MKTWVFLKIFLIFGWISIAYGQSDAERYDEMARRLLKGVYPLLAQQIVNDYGITEGLGLDIGCGGGYLTLELAKLTNLKIYGIDIDHDAIAIAQKNLRANHIDRSITFYEGDVQSMTFKDDLFDLIVSRGSFRFWSDKVKAFKEIYRVLKPGGVAFIGGGLGRYLSKEETEKIWQEMKNWRQTMGLQEEWERTKVSPVQMREILKNAGIKKCRLIEDEDCDCRMWVEIRK